LAGLPLSPSIFISLSHLFPFSWRRMRDERESRKDI
jgi:hypothetical protein